MKFYLIFITSILLCAYGLLANTINIPEDNSSIDSPCIDAGNSDLPPYSDGSISDMDALYFEHLNFSSNENLNRMEINLRNYPNPFNPQTIISFTLKENDDVNLSLFNVKGEKIKTLVNKK